jgi:nucleoside-diphosphate-sugar epimerase
MFIARLIKSIKDGAPITLQGESGLRVNPIYVDDAATAFQAALSLSGSNIFNIAGGEVLTLRSICDKIGSALNTKPNFIKVAGQPNDYIGNTELSDLNLGFTKTPFDVGIQFACAKSA